MLGTPGSEPPDLDLIEEVASGEGVSPFDLLPLYDSIAPDTTASLTSPEAEPASLLFTHYGSDGTVDGEGHVRIGRGD